MSVKPFDVDLPRFKNTKLIKLISPLCNARAWDFCFNLRVEQTMLFGINYMP